MANQYTAGAYMGVKPIEEDFGDDALKSYEIVMQQNAMKIAERKQKTAEAKAAQERLNTYFKDMDKYAAEALSIQPMDFDKGLTDHMILEHRNEVIKALRIIQDPMTSDAEKIMAKSRVQMLSKRAQDYVNDRKSIIEFMKSMSNVDTEGGWDSVLSAPVVDAFNRTIFSAGKKGTKINEDGSISAGDYITQRMGDNGTIITLKTSDILGEDITGTYSEIAAKLAGKMYKTVNEQKDLWDYAGKGVQSRAKEFYRNTPGGLIEVIKQDNWTEIDRMIGDDFDARFPDAQNLDKLPLPIRKLITQGTYKSWEDVREAYILTGRNKVKSENNLQLRNDPAYLNEYKRWSMAQKSNNDLYNAFLDRSQAVLSGDTDAISAFGSDKLISLPGGRFAAVSISGRRGDDFIFKARESVVDKDGKTSVRNAEDIVYDMGTESGRKAAMGILTQMYNSSHEGKEGSLLETEVDKRVDYTQSPYNKSTVKVSNEEIKGEINSAINRFEASIGNPNKKISSDDLENELQPFIELFERYGYEPSEISGNYAFKWGAPNMEFTLTDKNGQRADIEISGNTVKEFTDNLRKQIASIVEKLKEGYEDKEIGISNPNWFRRGVNPAQSPVSVSYTQSSTQRGANAGGIPKF